MKSDTLSTGGTVLLSQLAYRRIIEEARKPATPLPAPPTQQPPQIPGINAPIGR